MFLCYFLPNFPTSLFFTALIEIDLQPGAYLGGRSLGHAPFLTLSFSK